MDISKKITQLNTLMELSGIINSSLDIADIRKRAIEAATRIAGAEAGSLLFYDEHSETLYFDVALGEKGELVKTVRLAKGQGIAGWVAEHKEAAIVNDTNCDSRFYKGADDKSGFVTRNMICLPIRSKSKLLGVLQTINKKDGEFGHDELELLTALANQVGVAIENAKLYEELRDTFFSALHTLADSIEMRDPDMSGHPKRVMEYSLMIGREMGLSKKDTINLKLAAMLHDIGKIGIRDSVLLKTEALTWEEQRIMMMHPVYGADILHYVKQLQDILPGVKHHHERYDGSGYPDGLKGENIPSIARIIAVADTFDSMTSKKPYRNYLRADNALEELQTNAGRHFDPAIVEAFAHAYRKDHLDKLKDSGHLHSF